MKSVACVCAYCGATMQMEYWRTKKARRLFCDMDCWTKFRNEQSIKTFWSHVRKTETCWIWTGPKNKDGYGNSTLQNTDKKSRVVSAHRRSWMLHNGEISEGKSVLHNCPGGDNPACVNPAHLFLGTLGDNNRDRAKKGRSAIGERSGAAKLTDAKVVEVRRQLREGKLNVCQIARQAGVSRGVIRAIKDGKTWRHVLG